MYGKHDPAWIDDYLPLVLPHGWRIEEDGLDGARFERTVDRMYVIVSGQVERDGKRWVHLSCSKRGQLPTWEELVLVKEMFLGLERKAINIIPPRSQHVNIHPNVHHLFHCADTDPLPDFRQPDGQL